MTDSDRVIINNEVRNLKKEKELERPHRPSSILKYRKENNLEEKVKENGGFEEKKENSITVVHHGMFYLF